MALLRDVLDRFRPGRDSRRGPPGRTEPDSGCGKRRCIGRRGAPREFGLRARIVAEVRAQAVRDRQSVRQAAEVRAESLHHKAEDLMPDYGCARTG